MYNLQLIYPHNNGFTINDIQNFVVANLKHFAELPQIGNTIYKTYYYQEFFILPNC